MQKVLVIQIQATLCFLTTWLQDSQTALTVDQATAPNFGSLGQSGKGGGVAKKDGISLENSEEEEGICGWYIHV